jgi:hypothetical protein
MSNEDQNFVIEGFDNVPAEGIAGWDGQGGAPTIEPGRHRFRAVACTVDPTKAGDGKNIVVTYEKVDGGAGAGEQFRQWYLVSGQKFKLKGHGGRIAHVFRDALRVPGIDPVRLSFETKNVVGCEMYANASLETSTKYDPQEGREKTYTNVSLSQEEPVEEEQAAAAAPPPAPARANNAPPARPPAPPARPAAPPQRAR